MEWEYLLMFTTAFYGLLWRNRYDDIVYNAKIRESYSIFPM